MDSLWNLWWLVPAVLYGGGSIANRVRRDVKERHERKLELLEAQHQQRLALDAANRPPEPVCGCTHHLAKHDKQGRCHEVVETPTAWDADRRPVRYEAGQCNCQQYVGPEPLGTVYAPELIDPR
ncbi:hypothetical protein BOQ63_037840 [Streptomyces viridifaciens]|nr:hypothetical protein CP971_30870 [Streptomyces viridifaciens]UKZ09682.1 hypothetical protein BOQ63_037840 [Streptomyces viridifaciens]